MINIKDINSPKAFLLDGNLKFALDRPPMLSEVYHENSKLHPYELRSWRFLPKSGGLGYVSLKSFCERSAKSYKLYPSSQQVPFPEKSFCRKTRCLWDCLLQRRSQRDYSSKEVLLEDLGTVLHCSYGETDQLNLGDYSVSLRASPSAGALYPLDIYPLICGVDGAEKGLYHYNVRDNSLELLKAGNFLEEAVPLVQSSNNEWLNNAKVILFITATFLRNQMKYGERGYRGVLLDAGHLSQNILLAAEGLALGACVSMACMDDQVCDFLGIDGVEESVLCAVSIGHPASTTE